MTSSSSSSSPEMSYAAPAFDPSFFKYASLDDVLEELSTRFIMNLPDQELASVERLCFQVEQAHWYYEDFMREANPKLPSLPLKKFSSIFFNTCPLLHQWSADHEQLFNTFMHYKVRVPVCGAIMLNDKWDKCLLVKGWKSSAGWGFPKGKINQGEELHMCAIREVQEETGFNLTKYIRPSDYIEMTIREQSVALFVVGGIPENFPFQCRTRKEISKIEWFKLSDLPTWKRSKQVAGKFYLISPFVPPLKEFIRANKRKQNRQNSSADTNGDLTVQTNFEAKIGEVESPEERRNLSFGAVSLDRDTQGYSSSSVDNGDPQTPSPQSPEAHPVAAGVDIETEPERPMDPHFARLLSGLTLSASKPLLNGQTEPRPTSVTPTSATSAKSNARKSTKEDENMVSQSPGRSSPKDITSVSQPSDTSAKSLSISSRSNSSSVTARPQSAQPTKSEPSNPPPLADRHLKHLALLESVAQESAGFSLPIPVARPPVHPGTPSSVPPLPFLAENRSIPSHDSVLSDATRFIVQYPFAGRPVPPPVDDPFTVRPMTSQAAFPPFQQGINASTRQGSLLSILSRSNGFSAHNPQHPNGNEAGLGPAPISTALPPSPRQIQTRALAPLRVMPPPSGAFQLNAGQLTMPLLSPSTQTQPHIRMPGFDGGVVANMGIARSTNKAHLLSLLNPNIIARPTSTLHADTTRPNYPSSGTAAGGAQPYHR